MKPEKLNNYSTELMISAPEKRKEILSYNYKSDIKVYDNSVLRKEERDNVDFDIEYELKQTKDKINYSIKTISKRGNANLEDMAFPELDETFVLTINKEAQVLHAKKINNNKIFPKDGLIYMPILSLPKGKVSIGDTWDLDYQWKGTKGITYLTELKSKLVSFYKCELNDICAEIDFIGRITIPHAEIIGIVLLSNVSGKMLLNTRLGSVLWSYFITDDKLVSEMNLVESKSCVESLLTDPVVRIWRWKNRPNCTLGRSRNLPGT